ncbi:ABC transporter permease [Salinibacterium sp. SYSU T00001]|uniref:ABC transporter permease n=1 Tax=Homoserinimonas sedimenticola TaxID=2986805 RepID=UPI0022358216|nr:ABC transporter permease [Salinibacterium sedimenticola]MCW4386118.1 ABC transporter permease [Salinibacterium sedimenticola]
MITFILRRLATGVAMLVTISITAFVLLNLGATDTARRLVGQTASAEIVARKAAELGLDRPLGERFFEWITAALTGDLGRSWQSGQSVVDAIATRLPVTLSLTIGAVIVSAALAIALGALAAGRRGWTDRVVQVLSVIGGAIPGFLIALILVLVFAISLRWFPATGYVRPEDSLGGWLATIALPVIALSIGAIGSVAQQVRGSMIDALRHDYVRTLRARGLPHHRVVYRHVLRNAAGPALSTLGLQFIVMFGGAVIVEQVFSLPGIGQSAVAATVVGDVPFVMGIVIVTAILVVIVNLAVDLLQGWLNPKVRLS